jgi:Tfp pilus assembly protein PilF
MEHKIQPKRQIPFSFHNHFSTACRYQSEGNLDKADEFFQKAANECPEAWLGVACESMKAGDNEHAIRCFIQTIKASGNDRRKLRSICYNNIGTMVCEKGHSPDAEKYFRSALNEWNNPDSMANLALVCKYSGRISEAEKWMDKAILKDPANHQHWFTKSLIQLTRGNYIEGFRNYESRWKNDKTELTKIPVFRPEWNGEKIQGKTLLIYSEQGAGDTIQLLRYCQPISAMGIKLKIAVQKGLKPICERMGLFDEIIEDFSDRIGSGNVPPYDLHVPSFSLPRIFGTELDSIPQSPYLCWDEVMDVPDNGRIRVGIVWAGSASHKHDQWRSTSLESWLPLMSLNADFYSLQVGPRSIDPVIYDVAVADLTTRIKTFGDTASAINAMDLIITVDTSVAHLAGALGKPVWLLNGFATDWRWMLHGSRSPWYQSMRIFRQSQPGDWRWVFDEVKRELKNLCSLKAMPTWRSSEIARRTLTL